MSWILLTLFSALFLGLYDIAKKSALKDNAVPVVLLLNVSTAAVLLLPGIIYSYFSEVRSPASLVYSLNFKDHLLLLSKSILVGSSWICAFFALKHLPISIASPIRSSSPLWTILFAVVVMGERPKSLQWFGVALILIAFLALSRLGKHEGIRFHRNHWVGLMVVATLLGSASALFDKMLLQDLGYSPAVVQVWFSIYLVPVMIPLAIRWAVVDRRRKPFHWRWSIPLIAIFLLLADYLYFTAVSDPTALLSVISPLRRSAVIVAFLFGVLQLKEANWLPKAICIATILCGVCVLSY